MSDNTGIEHNSLSGEVVSVSAWKRARRETVTCPSGARVVIQRLTLQTLFVTGRVPETLVNEYLAAVRAEGSEEEGEASRGRSVEMLSTHEILRLAPASAAVLIAAMESPRVVLFGANEDAGEINLDDVPADDRAYLAAYAVSAVDAVPVATKGGEALTVGDLKSDGEASPGATTSIAGDSGEGVPTEAV